MKRYFDFCRVAIVCMLNCKPVVLVAAVLLLILGCLAQQPPTEKTVSENQSTSTDNGSKTMATIPSGTRISLQVMRPIVTRLAHLGDGIDLQVTVPVSEGDKVLIPAGTYLKGTLDKVTRKRDQTQLHIYLNSLVWPNGYSLPVTNGIEVVTTTPGSIYERLDDEQPGRGTGVAVLIGAPLAGMAIGALAGGGSHSSTTNPPAPLAGPSNPFGFPNPSLDLPPLRHPGLSGRVKGLAIGGAVGAIGGFVVAAAMSRHDKNMILDVGTPAELVLQNSLTVDLNRAADSANQKAPAFRPNEIVKRGGCAPGTGIPATPGTAATPDTVIPGTDTVIPGSPGTPGTAAIPCVPVP